MAQLPPVSGPFQHGCNEETYSKYSSGHEHQLSARVQVGSQERRVISICGGGVRGILPALFLEALSNQANHTPIYQLADLFGGTSTGALIAGTVNIPGDKDGAKYTASEVVQLFESESPEIFQKSFLHCIDSANGWLASKYDEENLVHVVQKIAGNTLLKDTNKDVFFPSWDGQSQRLFVFTRQEARENTYWRNLPLWVAVSASASAPTYFQALHAKISEPRLNTKQPPRPPENRKLMDGGLAMNSPVMDACSETMRLWDVSKKDLRVLSIGTGRSKINMPDDDAGKLGYAANISNILIAGSMDASEDSARRFLSGNNHFYSVQFQVPTDKSQLDDIKAIPYLKEHVFKPWRDDPSNQDKLHVIAKIFDKPAREAGETHATSESEAVV